MEQRLFENGLSPHVIHSEDLVDDAATVRFATRGSGRVWLCRKRSEDIPPSDFRVRSLPPPLRTDDGGPQALEQERDMHQCPVGQRRREIFVQLPNEELGWASPFPGQVEACED